MALINGWTARQAAGPGLVAGCMAVILWPIFAIFQGYTRYPFGAALAVASFCGLSILVLTVIDLRNRRRGLKVRPIRAFDVILGLALALPSSLELWALIR